MANRRSLVDVLKDFGESSSLHGIPKIVSSRQIAVKVLWSILLLATSGLFTYQLIGLFGEYFDFPIKTSVTLKFSAIRFPAVTICNINPVKSSKLHLDDTLLKTVIGAEKSQTASGSVTTAAPSNYSDYDLFNNVYGRNDTTGHLYNASLGDLTKDQLKLNVDSYLLWKQRVLEAFKKIDTDKRLSMGHQVEDMVHSAVFTGFLVHPLYFPYFTTTMNAYGNCYTLDKDILVSRSSGPASGLRMVLNLEVDEYIKQFSSGFGIRMVIHQPGTYPLPDREGITLDPGFETDVALKMVEVERLGGKYGDCFDGKTIDGLEVVHYTVPFCYAYCETKEIIKYCGCLPINAPDVIIVSLRICNTLPKSTDMDCIETILIDIQDGIIECNCKSKCHERTYETSVSGRNWPHDEYMKYVLLKESCKKNMSSMAELCDSLTNAKNDTESELPKKTFNNFASVNVYFSDLNYEHIKEEPLYNFIRFLSDIGGAMGLFMGASVLTYFEILQLILEVIIYSTQSKSSKTTPSKAENGS